MKIQSNIVEQEIATPPQEYEAYLYRFKNLINDKVYIGIHKGSVDDSYRHSSTNKEFAKVFADSKSKLRFEVLSYGDYREMQNQEYNILRKDDARNNSAYYNKSNGFPQYVESDLEKCLALVQQIEDNIFPVEKEDLQLHLEMDYLQSRFQDDPKLQRYIKESIDDAYGNTDKCNPVIVYEGRGDNGEDVRGDGNHTVRGAGQAKHAIDVPVMRVPYEAHCIYTDEELRVVGRLLNKRDEVMKKPNDVSDGIKHVLSAAANGVPYNSQNNVRTLKEYGFTGAAGSGEIKTILTKSKQQLDEIEMKKTTGNLFINYKANPHKSILQAKVASYNRPDLGQCSTFMSSAKFSMDRIMETLYANRQTCDRIVVVIHHPHTQSSDYFKKNTQPTWLNIVEASGMKWKVEFVEMEMWMEDRSDRNDKTEETA